MNKRPATRNVCSSPRYGLVTTADLYASGVSRSAICRRVQSGALCRRYPGVYSYGGGELSREAQWMAAVLACGEGSLLSHLSAAALYDASRWPLGEPHVIVPRRHRPVAGIVSYHCLGLDARDVTSRAGIPVTTVARMLVDLADIRTPHQLAYVINEAAFRRLFSLSATRRAMKNGRHGLGVLRRAIDLYHQGSAGTKSRYEDAFLLLTQLGGLPEPIVNTEHLGYEIDFRWAERRLVVEVDGNHSRPKDARGDAARDRVLAAAGYTILRFPGEQVERRPEQVLSRLAPLLRATPARAGRALRRSL
jgi:Protein of unknown function (DUF559)